MALCSESPKYTGVEVGDMLRWYARVMSDPLSSPVSRATYMKVFMAKYMHRLGHWLAEFERDHDMKVTRLHAPQPVVATQWSGNPRGGRGRGTGGRGSKGGKGAGAASRFCYGYCDPLRVCIPRVPGVPCPYLHKCASCGTAHTAATCKAAGTWDQAKASAAKRACGMSA